MLPTPISDEQSKAIQNLSTFGTAVVQSCTQLAGYMGRVLGAVPDDVVGIVIGDPLHAIRTLNAAKLDEIVSNKLQARRVKHTQPVSPSLAIPLLKAAYDESRPELQEFWAGLIAGAMDPSRASRVRQSFIETVKKFDPLDALALQILYESKGHLSPSASEFIAKRFNVSEVEVIVSSENLIECKCVKRRHQLRENDFEITTYGHELVRACMS